MKGKLSTLTIVALSLNAGVSLEAKKPNIIYILADDLGYGDLSCYGQKRFQTPNIDRLAQEGLRFTNHYAGSSTSAPSRCSLMTGLHTGHGTIRGNFSVSSGGRVGLTTEDLTFPQILKQQGYKTAIFGKWGIGGEGTKATPLKKGFDNFLGYLDQNDAHNQFPPFLIEGEKRIIIPENQNGKLGVFANDLFTKRTKEFIRENKDKTFFIYLPYITPHAELLVPEEDFKPFENSFLPEIPFIPIGKSSYREQLKPHAAFAGMITRMDRQIGEIMALLDELGIGDNTIVMFSSDNGPHNAGGGDPVYFNGSGGLRGIKRDLYEGGIRVPLIVRWKEKIKQTSEVDQISAFWDILPTMCEISGAKIPAHTDGISLLPTLLGQTKKQKQHSALYWEFPSEEKPQTAQAIRIGNFKAIRISVDSPIEIYDIITDFAEKKNIASSRPDLVKKANELFVSMHNPSPNYPIPLLDK